MADKPHIVYCHCAYARVVPDAVKQGVLKHLCEMDAEFEAVADLCELSARKDPCLNDIASRPSVKIAACYPRAVKWLFSAAGSGLDRAKVEVLNQRTDSVESISASLDSSELKPNLPTGDSQPEGHEAP